MTEKTSILFVEDDADFRETLVDAFKLKGYNSYGVGSIEEFNEIYNKSHFHLAFVDLNLPDGSGFHITRVIRDTSDTKIIILTARDTVGDRVEGYTHGADIYMIKPVSIAELLAATEAILRPRGQLSASSNDNQIWQLDTINKLLYAHNGKAYNLSERQYIFVKRLMDEPNTIIDRSNLWELISPNKSDASGKALSMFVARLRKEIEAHTQIKFPIDTISGRGYSYKT